MNVQDTIQYLKEKITEIETYAAMRSNDMPSDTKYRIAEIANRCISVVKQVIKTVEEATSHINQDDISSFLSDVIAKCDSAVIYTRDKIDKVVSSPEDDDIEEVKYEIKDAINELKSDEEFKANLLVIKEFTSSVFEEIEDYLARPENQKTLAKAKVATVKIAEKGISLLKHLLQVSDEDL